MGLVLMTFISHCMKSLLSYSVKKMMHTDIGLKLIATIRSPSKKITEYIHNQGSFCGKSVVTYLLI